MHKEILQGNAEFWTIIIEIYSARELDLWKALLPTNLGVVTVGTVISWVHHTLVFKIDKNTIK